MVQYVFACAICNKLLRHARIWICFIYLCIVKMQVSYCLLQFRARRVGFWNMFIITHSPFSICVSNDDGEIIAADIMTSRIKFHLFIFVSQCWMQIWMSWIVFWYSHFNIDLFLAFPADVYVSFYTTLEHDSPVSYLTAALHWLR